MNTRLRILNILFSFTVFLFSMYIAWLCNVKANFFYSFWYESLEISETIGKYSPNNKFKDGFELLSKKVHVDLFNGIVEAIHKKGEGLSQLEFENKKLDRKEKLLTKDEVIHLQDVANLIGFLKYVAYGCFLFGALILLFLYISKENLASIKYHIYGGIGVIALSVLVM
ncbi:MAG: DUF1461 domain-containing protein, partial [Pseudomonadota bacterium]